MVDSNDKNNANTDNDQPRFRVDRIQSSSTSLFGNGITSAIPEDRPLDHSDMTSPTNNEQSSYWNIKSRRASVISGLGGSRKKSVTLPKEVTETPDSDSTVYGRSFSYYTREALPNSDNYRNKLDTFGGLQRPTLDELRSEAMYAKKSDSPQDETGSNAVKFGWIEGVLVRCLLNIWGVMLFLRLSWVVAQAGVGLAIVIICLSATVTTLTALSMSAISTNGQIKGGGIYYMISRSLGPEFGGAVGAIFSFANATAVAMHTVGFAESLNDLLKTLQVKIVDNGVNDIRIVGTIALIVMQCIIIIGTEWESKAQIVLLMILLVAIGDFLTGAFMGPAIDVEDEISKGYVGLNVSILETNFYPDFRPAEDGTIHSFFTIFAIFFPAATGITAGANISGDLKDPGAAIPKGTLLAILTTTASYIIFALLAGAATLRDAAGPSTYIMTTIMQNSSSHENFTDLVPETISAISEASGNLRNALMELAENGTSSLFNGSETDLSNCLMTGVKCKWGSHNSFQIMELMAYYGPIIYAGCFAATLSSALACLVSAPKIFQALCKDKLYPGIHVFAKGFRKNNDPLFAYMVAFCIALAFILIADLNVIAPLISNFYMAAYAMVNFCTFHAALVKPLGWRPQFKYYSVYSSFFGFILCVCIMFLMSWVTALITGGILACLFFGLVYVKPEVNWGSSAQYQKFKNALNSVQSLNLTQDHVKNYRPQILVLSGRPSSRPSLIDFAYLMTKNVSMLICGHIIQERQPHKVRSYLQERANAWLLKHKVKAFYNLVDDVDFEEGARCLMQASGVGKLRLNVVLMGYKSDWINSDPEDFKAYFRSIHDALDNHLGLCILRVREGFDYSSFIDEDSAETLQTLECDDSLSGCESDTAAVKSYKGNLSPDPEVLTGDLGEKKKNMKQDRMELKGINGLPLPKSVINNITQFQRKQSKNTIDIWWLYDDGGLTILLPYIISNRSIFAGNKIRVFALSNKQNNLEVEEAALASLLSKFRIQYSALTIITDVMEKAKDSTREFFDGLINEFQKKTEVYSDEEIKLDKLQLHVMKEKTNRHLRLRELLLDHSRQANLIVMTLPIPRKSGTSAPLYMAWLECLTRDMPPFLLVRGNQESVLTYYS